VILNEDYRDLLSVFHTAGVDFLLVGAYAMAAHGFPRSTMDIDLWVAPTTENARKVLNALQAFGAPLHDLTLADLTHDDTVFQIGVAPRRIDIMTGIPGTVYLFVFRLLLRSRFLRGKRSSQL